MDFQRIKPHLPRITLLMLVAVVGVVDDTFLRPANLLSLAGDIVPLFIMALGLTLVIYIGGIDLSAQSMANMVTVVASLYLASLGLSVALLCVAAGFFFGNGVGLCDDPVAGTVVHFDPCGGRDRVFLGAVVIRAACAAVFVAPRRFGAALCHRVRSYPQGRAFGVLWRNRAGRNGAGGHPAHGTEGDQPERLGCKDGLRHARCADAACAWAVPDG